MKRFALCMLTILLFISIAATGFAASSLYIGNKDSKVYHSADCSHGQKTAPENRVYFYSRESAENSGYRRCHFCGDDIVEPGHGGGSSSNKNPSSNSGTTQQGSQINSQSQQSGGSQAGESRTFWEKAWEVVRVILIIACVAAWPIVISLPFSAIYQIIMWLKNKKRKKTSSSSTTEGVMPQAVYEPTPPKSKSALNERKRGADMKKKKVIISLAVVILLIIGFSLIVYFDMRQKMSWLSFVIWLAGTLLLLYGIGRSVKRTMPQIKNYGADEVFSSVGTIGVILAIVLAPVMTSGFGSFRIWDALCEESLGAQPVEFVAYYVVTSVAVSLGMALIFVFVGAVVIALPMAFIGYVIFRSSNMPSIAGDVGVESALFALGFILLSQFCGAIDYFAFGDELLRNLMGNFT